ncbi:MAG TPA: 2-C-methyl-D-erythritol 4-phosphate cytidylyltransferase, partial [Mycobacterium sp.]|nr:2-C-methyl-D-erythritol 4-phosphate cytidylyltransferase [Mycobacterium sp.]
MELSAIVPLPNSGADTAAAAFTPVAGEALLVRIVRMMLGAVPEDRIVVAAAEPFVGDSREVLASTGLSSVAVAVAIGSGARAHCLTAGLQYLGAKQVSHVLIHDIRRPLASTALRDRVIAQLRHGSAIVVPALAVTDSVKAVDAHGSVTGTLDRSTLRAVQYPRGFAADQLVELLARRTSDEFDELEDAIRAGVPIAVVEGDPEAFVAELPRDARFVEAIIAGRRPNSD